MLGHLARALLTLTLAGSLALTAWTGVRITQNPALRAVVERSADQIVAATDRMLAEAETPARIISRLQALLAEPDRNWLAIDAVRAVAAEQGTALPADLVARIDQAYRDDSSLLATAADCAACAWDPAQCPLSATLICQAPMVLTPLGDLAGLALESGNYVLGAEVDRINLVLSVVGLAATGLVVVTGGSSATVKLGASAAKLARKMGLVSPRLTALLVDAARNGVNWAALPAVRSLDDLTATLRPAIVAPVASLLSDTGRIADRLGPAATLHMIRYIDDAGDARRLAGAAEALGPKTIGRLEVLGKSRLLRATLRGSDTLWSLLAGFVGLMASLAGLAGQTAASVWLRALRRVARRR